MFAYVGSRTTRERHARGGMRLRRLRRLVLHVLRCLRLADPEMIPWTLLEKLAGKTSPREWIQVYEKAREGRRKKR